MKSLTVVFLFLLSIGINAQSKKIEKLGDNVESKVIEW